MNLSYRARANLFYRHQAASNQPPPGFDIVRILFYGTLVFPNSTLGPQINKDVPHKLNAKVHQKQDVTGL